MVQEHPLWTQAHLKMSRKRRKRKRGDREGEEEEKEGEEEDGEREGEEERVLLIGSLLMAFRCKSDTREAGVQLWAVMS